MEAGDDGGVMQVPEGLRILTWNINGIRSLENFPESLRDSFRLNKGKLGEENYQEKALNYNEYVTLID